MPGFQELLVIAVVAALVLGPNRLPKAAADVARLLARVKREAGGAIADLKRQADLEGVGGDLRVLRNELKDTTDFAKQAVRVELRALTDQPAPPGIRDTQIDARPTDGTSGSDGPTPTDGTALAEAAEEHHP